MGSDERDRIRGFGSRRDNSAAERDRIRGLRQGSRLSASSEAEGSAGKDEADDSRRGRARRASQPGPVSGDVYLPEVIIECIASGPYVRVSAMDPLTLTEVVMVGAASAGEAELQRLAIRKLEYALKRNKGLR